MDAKDNIFFIPVGKVRAHSYIFIETGIFCSTASLIPAKDANPSIDRTKFLKA